jgi:hypothetical protein
MPNKVYTAIETPITFKDSGGSAAITLQNLGFGAGRISARYDRGAGSIATLYMCRATVQFETAPLIGETVEIYVSTSDGTNPDGEIGTANVALTSDKRRNLKFVGAVIVDTISITTNITASWPVEISTRYFSVGVWNASAGDNLENTANASVIQFTPIPPELQ